MLFENFPWKVDCIASTNWTDTVLLARLRSGYTAMRKANAYLSDPSAGTLGSLYMEEPQTMEFWLQRCPNLDVPRQSPFGCPSPLLRVLTIDPPNVLLLVRATFQSFCNKNNNDNDGSRPSSIFYQNE